MKILTTEEKLKIAVDFIKSIEKYESSYDTASGIIDKLKDKAWHVLADLAE